MKFYKGPQDEYTQFRYKEHLTERGNNPELKVDLHIHRSAEILLVMSGYLIIKVPGNNEEKISAGEAAFFFPYQPHEYYRPCGCEYFRFNYSSSIANSFFVKNQGRVGRVARFTYDAECAKPILKRLHTWSMPDELKIKSFVYSLISDFSSQVELVAQNADDTILSRAIMYLTNAPCEGMTLSSVAKAIGCCDKYLSRAVNSIAGVSFSTFLSSIRIEKAIALLESGDKTMLEISEKCGFGSERSFYRQFQSVTGLTPRQFRKNRGFKTDVDPILE